MRYSQGLRPGLHSFAPPGLTLVSGLMSPANEHLATYFAGGIRRANGRFGIVFGDFCSPSCGVSLWMGMAVGSFIGIFFGVAFGGNPKWRLLYGSRPK